MGEQTATGICFPIRFGLWSVWSSPIRHRSGYGAQVGRKDSLAHPSIESFLTPIPATAQILAALHDADAPFYSSPKPPCPLVPSLPLILLSLGALVASFGQAHLLYSHLFCQPFVLFRMHVTVRRHQLRRTSELAQVIVEGWLKLGFVTGITLQDPKCAQDAPVHLREPHLPAELRLLARLAPADYGCVGLEEGEQFFFALQPLSFEHPALSLPESPLK